MTGTELDRLKTPAFKVLDRIFTAETKNRLPAQMKSKHLPSLIGAGLVTEMEIVLPGRFPVHVRGYQLTERGRLLYCQACTEVEG